jgi:SAM-dependent methyltransferase
MKISEGIKHRDLEIPDCSRNDLPEFFKEMGFTTGVEVGVYKGEYTEILAKSGLTIFGVDPWSSYEEYPYMYGQPTDQDRQDRLYEEASKRLAPYPNVSLLRETSMEAVKRFDDNSIDFVYIDGNHSFKYVAEDICEWVKKVKPGGFVCGHDYIYANPTNFHVHYVIDAYIASHAIKKFWVLGRKHPDKGEVRDRWRSWMFQKA